MPLHQITKEIYVTPEGILILIVRRAEGQDLQLVITRIDRFATRKYLAGQLAEIYYQSVKNQYGLSGTVPVSDQLWLFCLQEEQDKSWQGLREL